MQMQKKQHEHERQMRDKDLEMKRLEAESAEQLKRQEPDLQVAQLSLTDPRVALHHD